MIYLILWVTEIKTISTWELKPGLFLPITHTAFLLSEEILYNIPESHRRKIFLLSSQYFQELLPIISNNFSLLTFLLTKCLFSRVETSTSGYCYQQILNWKMQGKIVIWKKCTSVCNQAVMNMCINWYLFPVWALIINFYWYLLNLETKLYSICANKQW